MGYLSESIHVRLSKECRALIDYLKTKYPNDYKTDSDVIRAGIFTLERWKKKYEKLEGGLNGLEENYK